jgi:hypothetical protein
MSQAFHTRDVSERETVHDFFRFFFSFSNSNL